jgi:hypothetical protein
MDKLQFMQALLTKHAFERSSSEDTNMLEGHNQTLALPSHRIQEILTAQALITALMLAVKHCQAIPRYSRWIAAEEALMRNMGQNMVAGLNLPKSLLIAHLDLQWSSAADPASTADTPLMSVSKSLLRAMTLNVAVSSKDDKAWVSSTVTDGKPEPTQGWASKLGSSQSWDPQTDHGLPARLPARLPANISKNGNSFQETVPYNSDEACNRGFSPEANVEAPGPVIASESTASQMLHKTSQFSMRGCTRQCPNSDVEAIHQGEESDADVRDHSLPGTKQDVFVVARTVCMWPLATFMNALYLPWIIVLLMETALLPNSTSKYQAAAPGITLLMNLQWEMGRQSCGGGFYAQVTLETSATGNP